MLNCVRIFGILLLISLSGCGGGAGDSAQSFQKLADEFKSKKEFAVGINVSDPDSLSWLPIEKFSYDIKKTDSIMAPFLGEMTFECKKSSEDKSIYHFYRLVINHEYRDKQWQFKNFQSIPN